MERQQQNEHPLPNRGFDHCNGDGNCGEDDCPEPWSCSTCHTENDSILLQCINCPDCPGRKDQANSANNTVEEPPPALPTGHCNNDGNCGDCAPTWTCDTCNIVNKSFTLFCDGFCGRARDEVEYVPNSTNTSNGYHLLRSMANDYSSGVAAADTSKTTNNSRNNDTSTSVSFGMSSTTNNTATNNSTTTNTSPYKKKKTSTGSMCDLIDMTKEDDDDDDGIYTDNEGGDEDRLEDGELVDTDYDDDDEIYTKYSTSDPPTDTYAKCCGRNVPEDIAARSNRPMPTRCTLSKDALFKLHVGGYTSEDDDPKKKPSNPSNTPEFQEALRVLSRETNNIVWMPQSPRCVECQSLAVTLLVPTDDDRTGPRPGTHPNYWCFMHGRAYVKENGGNLVECPSECECGRSRHGTEYPLCTYCYKAMKCKQNGCGEKVFAVASKYCIKHDKAKGCGEEGCDEPRWRAGVAFCKEHDKAKGCNEEGCDEPRHERRGSVYCREHDPSYNLCNKCGKEPRAYCSSYCEGCASLCKAPECQAPLRNTGEKRYCGPNWCNAGHLGPEPTKKCAFCGDKKKKFNFHADEWKFAEDAVRKCITCKKNKKVRRRRRSKMGLGGH